jgi:hypothetical protein
MCGRYYEEKRVSRPSRAKQEPINIFNSVASYARAGKPFA